jgi:hypothetical protein
MQVRKRVLYIECGLIDVEVIENRKDSILFTLRFSDEQFEKLKRTVKRNEKNPQILAM